ncbi:hypothetical protein IL306_015330 [Fusarium sp. DS 682]|nr:hypothetical protein IL306_015330 [Fusarium sp. DS 682]
MNLWQQRVVKRDRSIGHTQDGQIVDSARPRKVAKTSAETGSERNASSDTKNAKDAKKIYLETLKKIDKDIDILGKKVKAAIDGDPWAYTTSNYAELIPWHFRTVEAFIPLDSTMAVNLLLSMADASHTDLDTKTKMAGHDTGESTGIRTA